MKYSSPCINAGDPNSQYNDPNGTRNDIGAYPFSGLQRPPLEPKVSAALPEAYLLDQNFPNPFNPTTEIRFSLPKSALVKLEVFNVLGQQVAILVDNYMGAGLHSVVWDGKNSSGSSVASGIYLYRLTAGDFTEVKKMSLLK